MQLLCFLVLSTNQNLFWFMVLLLWDLALTFTFLPINTYTPRARARTPTFFAGSSDFLKHSPAPSDVSSSVASALVTLKAEFLFL